MMNIKTANGAQPEPHCFYIKVILATVMVLTSQTVVDFDIKCRDCMVEQDVGGLWFPQVESRSERTEQSQIDFRKFTDANDITLHQN